MNDLPSAPGVPLKWAEAVRKIARQLPRLQMLLAPAILLLAGFMLWRQVQALSLVELRAAWSGTSVLAVTWSVLATAVSFACLASYERLATQRAVPGRVPATTAWRVGGLAHAISNTLGFHALTGGALRYHLYRRLGLGVADVARVVAMVGVCVGTGVVLVSAIALLWVQVGHGGLSRVVMLGAAILLPAVVLGVQARRRIERDAPPAGWTGFVGLSLLATLEMTAAIGALYALLPADVAPPPAQFALVFVAAMLLGIVSHAPGGIGVFEATMLAAMPGGQGHRVLVALLLYRALYNLLPFVLAMMALAIEQLSAKLNSNTSLRNPPLDSVRGRV